jgi:hypothetical protein
MKYTDGKQASLGDKVRLSDGAEGVVVCSIDTNEYSSAYPKEQWDYLKRGVVVNFEKYGLIHYEEAEPGLELVGRSTSG